MPKLDLPSPAKRTKPVLSPAAESAPEPPTFADELRDVGGHAGTITGNLGSLVYHFSGTGPYAREGRPAMATTMVVSRGDAQRLLADVISPSRPRSGDRRTYTLPIINGVLQPGAATLGTPAVLNWLAGELEGIRNSQDGRYGPLLVLCAPELAGDVDWPRLEQIAADNAATVAVVQDSDEAPAWEAFDGAA